MNQIEPQINFPDDPDSEKFEVSFRILGNEVLAMQLFSKSKTKNWIFFSIFSLLLLAIMVNQLIPVIVTLSSLMN